MDFGRVFASSWIVFLIFENLSFVDRALAGTEISGIPSIAQPVQAAPKSDGAAEASAKLISNDPDRIPIATDEKIWKKISDEDGVRTYEERSPQKDVVAFRGEITMPVSVEKIIAVLRDEKIRKKWVDALVETKLLQQTSTFQQDEYNRTGVPWPFQDRDFVFHASVTIEPHSPKSMKIVMHSIETPLAPEKKGVVRGELLHSIYFMKEVPGAAPKTEVMIEMAVDPKGAIPLWLVNLTQRRWPHHTLLALRHLASQPDLVVPKDIEDYFKTDSQ